MKFLQKLGKSLMLPVAVLPICGILMGIGYQLCPASMQGGDVTGTWAGIGYILVKAGGALIDNIPWLFVVGVAVGMSDDNHGSAALAGIVSWLMITNLLSSNVITTVIPKLNDTYNISLALEKIQNPFIGIITGLIGGLCYNKFKNTKLPDFLAFFSGRRFVIIITALVSVVVAVILAIVWPLLFSGLTALGKAILKLGGIGAGLYACLNRLLIPFGLHHALNNIFWFDTVGIGDLSAFWAGKTSADVGWSLGMYMSGFFPCIMFGIPAAALAMIKNAKNKKKAIGIFLSSAICAFICGVTEPFEFAFVYAAFPLYVIYSILYGIFSIIAYYVGFRAGFSFSAGIVDLIFSSSLPAAEKTWLIIPLGIAAFVVFYFTFDFAIRIFDLKTPGREDDDDEDSSADVSKIKISDAERAEKIIAAIGGKKNITDVDCCATRLRLSLKDSSLVNKKACSDVGVLGVVIPDKQSCQLIIGVTVQQVLEDVKGVMAGASSPSSVKERKKVSHNDIIADVTVNTENIDNECKIITDGGSDVEFSYLISDPLGMHARPAAGFAKTVSGFKCKVTVIKDSKSADASSVISLMSLNIKKGDTIKISAEGQDAAGAIKAIKKYLTENM